MKYLLLISLLIFSVAASVPVFAQSNIPSPHCLGSCPQTSVTSAVSHSVSTSPANASPSNSQTNPSTVPSTTQSHNSTVPCATSQSSVSSQSTGNVSALSRQHGKWHFHGKKRGGLQNFIQLLWQLLQQLFQKLGINLPNINPCGTNSSPSTAPSNSPSTAPSSGAGGGGGTVSGTPSGNPSPTVFGTSPSPSTNTGTTSSGFITKSGTKLMLNGKPYKSFSFNFSAVGACWSGTNWTTQQMDTFFAALPKDSLARFFAPPNNTDSASFVQSVVKEADKYSIHLIISLADADVDNNCDPEDASGNGKSAAYYTNAVQSGSTYYNWVQSVVKPLANDPGVGMWEIVNEPFHAGASYDQVGAATAANYVKTAASIIRALDKNHLITMGTVDIGETGGTSGMQTLFGYLDVVNDHDYAWDYQNHATISSDFAQEKQVAQALNKPFMVDEAGVEGGSSCNGSNGLTLANRVTYLTTKANDYLSSSGGASALIIWLYTGDNNGGCSYENINTSDPLMSTIKNYTMPN